jgi:hypothetical protein
MDESEALIRRREMLLERISKMQYEVDKIDDRVAMLGRMSENLLPEIIVGEEDASKSK